MGHLSLITIGLLASLAFTIADGKSKNLKYMSTIVSFMPFFILDFVCPEGKSDNEVIVVEAGDSFDYRTQEDEKYSGNTDCSVMYEMGESCAKMQFSCPVFQLGKGDSLFVKTKRNKK